MKSSEPRLGLFCFIDAFGWELLKRSSFLSDELPYRHPLGTVLGYSSTCDPTILTGKMPWEHGHFSFFYYDPPSSPFRWLRWLRFLPRTLTSRGRVRHWISRIVGKLLGYTGYFQLYNMPFDKLQLFNYSEKRDIYQPGGINGGLPTVFDHLRKAGIPFSLSDWRRSEEYNLSTLRESFRSAARPRLAYLYLAAMDAILHAYGTQAPQVQTKIAWYERQLRDLLVEARRHYGEVALYCFSDHGMTDVRETVDLISKIDTLGLELGVDYAAVYDSTMIRFWFLRPRARALVEELLHSEKSGQILSREQLKGYGCHFPGARYGHLFFLLNPGMLLCPSFMGERPLKGMHGYDPHDRDSMAMFATSEQLALPPSNLSDLHDLMLREVGL